ncbi:MAG: hypothetical protein V2J07_00990 [Anaerolineae bacterium]|jgi:predicted dienelactone hydrolase|nr:hypothetical protein [Anaerolineae bacterium]
MKKFLSMVTIGVIGIVLTACNPAPLDISPTEAALEQSTEPVQAATQTPAQTSTITIPTATKKPNPFPLADPGPYYTSKQTITYMDETHSGREIEVTLYYPAVRENDANGQLIRFEANPDMSGAPYPLVMTGDASGKVIFREHLASHGFVMAIVGFSDEYNDYIDQVVDYPRDFLFVLDQLTSNPPDNLVAVIDTDQVGVAGYSGDGFVSLALSGVRIDPEYYLSFCMQISSIEPKVSDWYIDYSCSLASNWDELVGIAGEEMTTSSDGLWQPLIDERIRAVMPMAPDGAWLYGELGLAAADLPMLIIAPTEDEYVPYQLETRFIFEHAGSPELFMISFVGRGHGMPYDTEQANRMRHFTIAFMGTYLQGREDYRTYFSEDFVTQFDDLAWGMVPEE